MFSWIAVFLQKAGVLGVALLMLIENLVPLIPSELIMPTAGFEAQRGVLSLPLVIVAGTVGSIIGGSAWYWVGRALGLERLTRWAAGGGRWLTLSPEEIARAETWFQRWGRAAVCIGRALPGVRGVICIPTGIVRMPFSRFLLWSSIGAALWTTVLAGAGYLLAKHYNQVERWLNPVTDVFFAACLALYFIRLFRQRTRR